MHYGYISPNNIKQKTLMLMTIPNENFNTAMLLSDLGLQCKLFNHSINRLKIASEHLMNTGDGTKITPLEIVAECTVCLSSMSAIRRLLKPSSNSNKAKGRGEVLYNLLNQPNITNISSYSVRNSWEHHDERLDRVLSSREAGTPFSELHVNPKTPKEGGIIIRRFDPTNLSIHFSGDEIKLKPCITEIDLLIKEIDNAYSTLQENTGKVYPTSK